jgi:Flp pilus assembly protein TadD
LLDRIGDDLIMGWPTVPGKVAAAKPTSPEAQFAMAEALQARGDNAGATIAYRTLHLQHPRVPEVANLLALSELRLGAHASALEHAARACQLNMKQARYKNTLAACLWMNGRRDEALASVQAALIDDPNLAEAHENLRAMQAERMRAEVTAETLADALNVHPDSPQLLVRLAGLHAEHGSAEKAASLYSRALAIEPANTDAKLGLARLTGREAA